jgi:hypothetical protein
MKLFSQALSELINDAPEKDKSLQDKVIKKNKTWIPSIIGLLCLVGIIIIGIQLWLKKPTQTNQIINLTQITNNVTEKSSTDTMVPSTETNQPTLTPTPIYIMGSTLFEDDFEQGISPEWHFGGRQNWELIQEEDGNHAIQVTSPDFSVPLEMTTGNPDWQNYEMEISVKLIKPAKDENYGFSLATRYTYNYITPPTASYLALFQNTNFSYSRYAENEWINLGGTSYPGINPGSWHRIRVEVFNDKTLVFFDDVFISRIRDKFPLDSGQIAFRPEDDRYGMVLQFDDIRVRELLSTESN